MIQERDEARQALALTQEKLKDYEGRLNLGGPSEVEVEKGKKLQEESKEKVIEAENSGIYPELAKKIEEVCFLNSYSHI